MPIKFTSPAFLFALFFIAVPIIVHLFNFRRFKKVLFTNVRFLKELKEETSSRNKLKHLLVLISRILAVSFLVFAFAQPYIPLQNTMQVKGGTRAISIFIDNSFSMEALAKEGTLLDVAKNKAKEIASAYQPSDQFQLLTNDFTGAQQRLINREELFDLIEQVKISPVSKKLSEIISRQKDALSSQNSAIKLSYVVSDFQKSNDDFEQVQNDSLLKVTLVPLNAQNTGNVFIDSCWFSAPAIQLNQPVEFNIVLKNTGNESAENVPLKLLINGLQKSVTSLSVPAKGESITKLSFSVSQPGWQKGEISIIDHPITFDDHYYFSFEVASQLSIYSLSKSFHTNPYVNALFGKDAYFSLKTSGENQVDYTTLQQSNVVILDELKTISSGMAGEIKKFTEHGGSLVLFPDSAIDFNSWQSFLQSVDADHFTAFNSNPDKVEKLSTGHALFKDVFEKMTDNMNLPSVSMHYELSTGVRTSKETLIRLQSGGAFLNKYSFGKGNIYLFTVPMDPAFSNFTRHALFVPVLYKICLLSHPLNELQNTIGKNNSVTINKEISGEETFHLVNKEKAFDVIPESRNDQYGLSVFFGDFLKESGNYDLQFKGNTVADIAMNYNRNESQLDYFDATQLQSKVDEARLSNFKLADGSHADLAKKIAQANEGISLWKWCIILVLVFLGLEIVFLKLL